MNILANIHPLVIVALAAIAVFLVVISLPSLLFTGRIGAFREKKIKEMEQWHKNLFFTDHTAREQMAWLEWGSVIVFVLIFFITRNIFIAAIAVTMIWVVPPLIYDQKIKARRAKFEENLPMVLDQMTSATKAGKSLSQAIADVSLYAPFPLSQELGQITSDQKLGIDLATSLKSAKERVGSRAFDLAVTSMIVNIDLGGNLPKTMQTMSASLKEFWRLDQKLTTASAEGRKGGMILCIMPLVILIIVLIMQPQVLTDLLSQVVGYFVIFAAVVFYFGGLFWMHRILQVDI